MDAAHLRGSRNCLARVIASDGLNSTAAESGVFGVESHAPKVMILSADVLGDSRQVSLTGSGLDVDDGPLPDEKLVWRSRHRRLGTGPAIVTKRLRPGLHRITLTGVDADGNRARARVTLRVPRPGRGAPPAPLP